MRPARTSLVTWLPSRIILVLVPFLLVLVAAFQVRAARFGTLTPWKGGGFGMFATMDGPPNRFISIVARTREGVDRPVRVPFGRFESPEAFSSSFARRLTVAPTPDRLRVLAAAVLRAHLIEPVSRTGLSARLTNSAYRSIFSSPAATAPELHLLGPRQTAESFQSIRQMKVTVLRFHFDHERYVAVLHPLIPAVTVGADARVGMK